MNLSIDLSPQLANFKDRTMNLSSPLRGYVFSHERFIRTAHNSFIRRLDIFDSDTRLMEEVAEHDAEKDGSARKRSKKQAKKAKSDIQYHYIAYVPTCEAVWELDSMKTKPVKLGMSSDSKPLSFPPC